MLNKWMRTEKCTALLLKRITVAPSEDPRVKATFTRQGGRGLEMRHAAVVLWIQAELMP